jgi:glycosyltransferase involved in cell wall biosynthesis
MRPGRTYHLPTGPSSTAPRRIAIDLTATVPGGATDDVTLWVAELIRQLSHVAVDFEFVLLTGQRSHEDLAPLDAQNVRRHRVEGAVEARHPDKPGLMPTPEAFAASLLWKLKVDLLFCPFTEPVYYDPTIPIVSVIVDLQHLYYSQFRPADYQERSRHVETACQLAARVVCISDYVRETLLESSGLDADRITTIHIGLPRRFPHVSPEVAGRVRRRLRVEGGRFLIYPAEFSPHKNHAMLLTAFGMFRSRHPESNLQLVCAGTPDAQMDAVRERALRMGLDNWVAFPGHLSDDELAVLLQSALAMIFPSLHEGLGVPVLEAMVCGTPVLCSDVTSLPDLVGAAALLFDPRKPKDIVSAIEQIDSTPALAADLARRGHARSAAFGGPSEMARQYLRVFHDVLTSGRRFTTTAYGIHQDGWLGERTVITYGASHPGAPDPRHIELVLTVPSDHPLDRATVWVKGSDARQAERQVIRRGAKLTIRGALLPGGGAVEVVSDTVFRPLDHGMGDDARLLSCICKTCRIVTPRGGLDLLPDRT